MLEMRRKQEDQRHQELEERKQKEAEAKRLRLEEAEKKRLAMQQAIKQRDEAARRNFIVKKTTPTSMDSGPSVFGLQDVMKTKEQLAEDKRIAMQFRIKPLKLEGLAGQELKKTVNELWDTIIQLESDKYDLEEEQKRQEYHLKELTERQKQINKNKALKMGLDIEELSGVHPPKVRLASKYERRIDRRTFGEKTELFNGGYVKVVKKVTDEEWKKKVDEFLEQHAEKHVPKWDPSAPRKDVTEPGKGKIYEDDDDSDDEATGALADKLRGYMEQQDQQQAAESRSQSRKSSVAAAADPQQDRARRRSSQVSNASSTTGARQPPAAPQQKKLPPPPPQEEGDDEEEEEGDEEEEEEEEEEDEEEYEDEEEE